MYTDLIPVPPFRFPLCGMDSEFSSSIHSTPYSSLAFDEVQHAAAIPCEEALNTLFAKLRLEICVTFWMRTRVNLRARSVGREAVHSRRRLSRLSLNEVMVDVAQHLELRQHQCMRSTIHALQTAWSRPIAENDLSLLNASRNDECCPEHSWVLATFLMVFSRVANRFQSNSLSESIACEHVIACVAFWKTSCMFA